MLKRFLFGGVATTSPSVDLALLVLRLVFGLSLALAHGMGKVPVSDRFIDGVANLGFPMPVVFAWAAALSEFAGGLLLAAGLATRPAAFFVAFTMATAHFGRHGGDPFDKRELSLLYLGAAVALLLVGAGRVSIDALFRRSR